MMVVIMPLGVVGDSKMSGDEPPLKVHKPKIRPTKGEQSRITQHSDKVSFIFKIQCVKYMRQCTLFIGECLGEQDRGVRVSFVRSLLEGRSKKP